MENNKIIEEVMNEINELFGRVFFYNSKLLASNVLKQAGAFIKMNTDKIMENLKSRRSLF